MILVDTGYFIALLSERDQLHTRAAAWAGHLREPLLVTEHVLVEVVNHFSSTPARLRAHVLATVIRTNPQYVFQASTAELLDAGLALHAAVPDKEWSLTDCISFHVRRQQNISRALAHDKHFVQAGFDAMLTYDPPVAGA